MEKVQALCEFFRGAPARLMGFGEIHHHLDLDEAAVEAAMLFEHFIGAAVHALDVRRHGGKVSGGSGSRRAAPASASRSFAAGRRCGGSRVPVALRSLPWLRC